MNQPEIVISCPHCLRQYAADPSIGGKLAQCGTCKSHFTVTTAVLSSQGDAIVLENEILPQLSFFKEGCEEFICQSRDLLQLAGRPVTMLNVALIAETIPYSFDQLGSKQWREGYCSRMLETAHNRWQREKDPRPDSFRYFLEYLPARNFFALDMLQAAMSSITRIEWTPDPPRKPGPLERWAANRGW